MGIRTRLQVNVPEHLMVDRVDHRRNTLGDDVEFNVQKSKGREQRK